jgi:hypothetical protein
MLHINAVRTARGAEAPLAYSGVLVEKLGSLGDLRLARLLGWYATRVLMGGVASGAILGERDARLRARVRCRALIDLTVRVTAQRLVQPILVLGRDVFAALALHDLLFGLCA